MAERRLQILMLFAFLGSGVAADCSATAADPRLLRTRQEAESRGFTFEIDHDEILARAKKEGKLRALAGLDPANIKAMANAFRSKYPFLDFHVEEITGTDSARRFILELKSGRVQDWDAILLSQDFYNEYLPYMKKIDILGMAEHGVLVTPPKMVDPVNRNIVAHTSAAQIVAYHNKLLSADKVPNTWEDFLKPEFKGRKFVADIRPTEIAALVPAWGLEKVLDFARKLASQEPIWVRGATRTIASMAAGEYMLFIGANYDSFRRFKDPAQILGYKIVAPVPTRIGNMNGVLASAPNPYAALLWLEFQSSPEGQKISDKYEPFGASIFTQGSALETLVRGREISLVEWKHSTKMQEYQEKVVQAYGFPRAEMKK